MTTESAVVAERRFTDGGLLALLDAGLTLQEAAQELGVTKQAASLRVKAMGQSMGAIRQRREAARLAAARQMDMEALQQGERLLTVREAAQRTGWSRENVQRAITLGLLPAHKLGRQWFVTEAAVRHWIETAPHRPGPAPGTPRAPRKPPKQEGQG
jgi:excisionase family DNA binding protein